MQILTTHSSYHQGAAVDTLVAIPPGTLHHKASREGAVERIALPGFRIGRHLVTVADYAAFIDAGGYDDASQWSPEGWRWRLDGVFDGSVR